MSKSILAGLVILLAVFIALAGYAYYYSSRESPVSNVKSSGSNTESGLSISAIMLTRTIRGKVSLVGFIMISNIGDEEITIKKIIVKETTITYGDTSTIFNNLGMNCSALPYTVTPRESISIEAYAYIPNVPYGYYGGSPNSYESILGSHIKSATLIIVTSDGNYTVKYIPTPVPTSVEEEIPPTNMLQIQDVVFFRTVSPDGQYINLTLQYAVKNIGPNNIELLAIGFPELDRELLVGVILHPGQIFADNVFVLKNYKYTPGWEPGTEHLVVFVYRPLGETENRTVAIKAVVQ